MTTVFQVVLSKNDKRFFINDFEILQSMMQNSLTLNKEDFLTRNLNIIENDIKFIKKQLLKNKMEFNDDTQQYYFSIERIHDNIDSKIVYIHYPHENQNFNIDSKLLLTDEENCASVEEINFDDYLEKTDLEEEYVKYYKIGENDVKEIIFRTAKENKDNINILTGLMDGIISRDKDNILNGFLKQYGKNFTNETLFTSLEHALCLNNENDAKIIIKYIDKKDEFLNYHKNDSINFLKTKNVECKLIELI